VNELSGKGRREGAESGMPNVAMMLGASWHKTFYTGYDVVNKEVILKRKAP